MTLIQRLFSSPARLMCHQAVLSAALLVIGPVAVTVVSVKLSTLTAAVLKENGR